MGGRAAASARGDGVTPIDSPRRGGRAQLTGAPTVSMDSPTRANGPVDKTTRQLVSYVNAMSAQTLTAPLLDALGATLVDSIACLVAGSNSEPAHIAARLAKTTRGDLKSTVVGYGVTTTPELAGFANACMVRHADYNDIPHYSDLIPGILAVGEAIHASGTEVLLAITAGYDVASAIPITGPPDDPRRDGWDYGLGIGAATAMGVGKLLALTDDQMANALSLSIVPQVQLRVTRAGILSMWKGCATASSVRNGIFAALHRAGRDDRSRAAVRRTRRLVGAGDWRAASRASSAGIARRPDDHAADARRRGRFQTVSVGGIHAVAPRKDSGDPRVDHGGRDCLGQGRAVPLRGLIFFTSTLELRPLWSYFSRRAGGKSSGVPSAKPPLD